MQLSVGADGLSATGTITINGAEFDVAELSAAAAADAHVRLTQNSSVHGRLRILMGLG